MLDAFDVRYSDAMRDYCKKNNMSLYEFITLCSIVQEEALTPDSAENIASVLVNRLEKGSKLQCDVTYFYAQKLLDYGFQENAMTLIIHTAALRFRQVLLQTVVWIL